MGKDEAPEKWLEAALPEAPHSTRLAVCGAWHAAVQHTLEYVTGELRKKSHECSERRARWYSDLADLIARMEP